MGMVAKNAELAFLSACQTAVGDEKIPEESAHLAAGMMVVGFKGVVATMWSIGDADAPHQETPCPLARDNEQIMSGFG